MKKFLYSSLGHFIGFYTVFRFETIMPSEYFRKSEIKKNCYKDIGFHKSQTLESCILWGND